MDKPEYTQYVMTQVEVAEKLFIHPKTVMVVEKRALEKIRTILERRGIKAEDILED
jgi:hypothetical protein